MSRRDVLAVFFVDMLIGVLLMLAISGAAFLTTVALAFLIPSIGVFGLLWPAILLGPAVVFLLGLMKWRVGMLLSPLSIALVPVVSLAGEFFSVWQLRLQEQPELIAPAHPHDIIILATDFHPYCDPICVQILAQTSYQVAKPTYYGEPYGRAVLFSKGRGEICYGKDGTRELHGDGFCAIGRPVGNLADGLVFHRFPIVLSLTVAFPGLVHGSTFNVNERTNREDRVLGRWIIGDVRGMLTTEILPPTPEHEIIGKALGLHIDGP